MACDIVLMNKDKEIEDFARKLGFTKVFFKEDIKSLKILQTENYSEKRKVIERKQIKILLNPHLLSVKDSLHYRRSGLDHILCNVMHKNNVAMAFTLNSLNNYIEIGRLMKNILFLDLLKRGYYSHRDYYLLIDELINFLLNLWSLNILFVFLLHS